jgi:hypothetical protein
MPIYEQVPVRLQLSLASAPPVDPLDANTGLIPRFWRGESVALQIGCFDAGGLPIDLSNLTYLQFVLQNASNSVAPLVVKTVLAAAITQLTTADWLAGLSQQATVILDPADTDQGLGGLSNATFWLVIQGLTAGGAILTYGAGACQIYDTGALVPVAAAVAIYTSLHAAALVTGNITAVPTSNNHTEKVTVSGIARTSIVILPITGMVDGGLMRVRFILPATANIIIQVASGTAGNVISTISTGQVLSALLEYYFDYAAQAWVPLNYIIPAI